MNSMTTLRSLTLAASLAVAASIIAGFETRK